MDYGAQEMSDLLEDAYQTKKRHFVKASSDGVFTPKIKVRIEDTKTKQLMQFDVESNLKMYADKDAQERLREDLQARLNIVLDKIFLGWK
jgi:hypothetical protein